MNLVDERVPEHRDSYASSSHELSLESQRKMVSDKQHSIKTHFSKDRIYEICQRTKITTAPRRRRIGGVSLRAEYFGDLITAGHKVFTRNCESRNNHRYAVVVQDLAQSPKDTYLETIIDMPSWCKTWQLSGFNRISARQKLPRKLKGTWKSSRGWLGNQKTFTLSMPWSLAKPVKVCRRIIVRRPSPFRNKWDCWQSSTQN